MAVWRYYGREAELGKAALVLEADRDWRNFGCVRIHGRRGIGKTALFHETGRRGTKSIPFVSYELPSNKEGGVREACKGLRDAAIEAGAVRTFPHWSSEHNDRARFREILRHLIRNGVVVALDEFHNACDLGLESSVKVVIDGFGPLRERAPGKLVLMGSHQQLMFKMFADTEPLHQRADSKVTLGQWPVSTVLEVASEQGFLERPGLFLTMWTAFGGIPRNWERFATGTESAGLRDFSAWRCDDAWRLAFLELQREIVNNPDERFDSKAFVELAGETREALLWLALNWPRGAKLRQFPKELRGRDPEKSLGPAMKMLSEYLELAEMREPFLRSIETYPNGKGTRCWRISDNNTIFQIAVLRVGDMTSQPSGFAGLHEMNTPETALARLQRLEDCSLERLFGRAMVEIHGHADHGIEAAHDLEIDLVAHSEEYGETLWLGGCKRDAAQHKTSRLLEKFDRFMAVDFEDAERWRKMRRRHFLASPEFTAEQRAGYRRRGFECRDIHDLARAFGLDPEPVAGTEPPRLNDTPSFDI